MVFTVLCNTAISLSFRHHNCWPYTDRVNTFTKNCFPHSNSTYSLNLAHPFSYSRVLAVLHHPSPQSLSARYIISYCFHFITEFFFLFHCLLNISITTTAKFLENSWFNLFTTAYQIWNHLAHFEHRTELDFTTKSQISHR